MLWLLSHIRREKTGQIQRCPHAIVRRDIWLCSAQTKRDLSAPMGLEQIKQDRKAVEIPPGNYPTQTIRIPIQIGAHRRRAASVQKTDHTRWTRAIGPAKPIPLEPFTRIIQVFLAPSMIQKSLDLGIRKTETSVTPRRQRRRQTIRAAMQRKRRFGRAGTFPHQTRQPQRIARSGNDLEKHAIKYPCRIGAGSDPRARTAQPRRIVPINEQYNLLIAGHLQQLNEHTEHRVNLVRARHATRDAFDVTHLISS